MTNPHDHPDRIVHVRGPIPSDWAKRLKHLEADLGVTRPQLVTQAVALLLRFHEHGDGIPEHVVILPKGGR